MESSMFVTDVVLALFIDYSCALLVYETNRRSDRTFSVGICRSELNPKDGRLAIVALFAWADDAKPVFFLRYRIPVLVQLYDDKQQPIAVFLEHFNINERFARKEIRHILIELTCISPSSAAFVSLSVGQKTLSSHLLRIR